MSKGRAARHVAQAIRATETLVLRALRPDHRPTRAAASDLSRGGGAWIGLTAVAAIPARTRTAARDGLIAWAVASASAFGLKRAIHRGRPSLVARIHPAVLAQATATTSLLFEGRFFWGVGAGEALNEHIVGVRWPPPAVQRDLLAEAIEVIRALWTGETVEHRGEFYEVDNARLFDPPTTLSGDRLGVRARGRQVGRRDR